MLRDVEAFSLAILIDPQSDNLVDYLEKNDGHDERIKRAGAYRDKLCYKKLGIAEEQAVAASRIYKDLSEEAGGECPDNTTDTVDTKGIEGVVIPKLGFHIKGHITDQPAASPMISAERGLTKPEAGVIVASPAIEPVAAPNMVGFPR